MKSQLVMTDALHQDIIKLVREHLHTYYIVPEIAEEVGHVLADRLANGDYREITSPVTFAAELTEHMQVISRDKHLRLFYQPILPETAADEEKVRAEMMERYRIRARVNNYGFYRVERRPGNVGYLDLRNFFAPDLAGEAAASAMSLLSNTDALILDLRNNGGGSPAMVSLMCSYFLPAEPIHLNTIECRCEGTAHQFWSLPFVPGKRFLDKPLFILTSRKTFSAAEEFVYNLKNLKRAMVFGEVTSGGAHPGDRYRLTSDFELFVPTCRSVNPITHTNWEGIGIEPDVPVGDGQALETAERRALEHIVEKYEGNALYEDLCLEAKDALLAYVSE